MEPIPPEDVVNGDTYYLESFGPNGSLRKYRGTVMKGVPLFYIKNIIVYGDPNNTYEQQHGFYIPSDTNPTDPYYWRFYKPVAEDLMTKQVLRKGLGIDEETLWGLHKHHINPNIGRGGKRKTNKHKIKKSVKKKKQTRKRAIKKRT